MIVCVLSPRFELVAALGGERRALVSEPVAVAPEAGAEQAVGEVSAAAEAFGVVRGMRLGEALARCPELRLVPPDPLRVRELWTAVLDRLGEQRAPLPQRRYQLESGGKDAYDHDANTCSHMRGRVGRAFLAQGPRAKHR